MTGPCAKVFINAEAFDHLYQNIFYIAVHADKSVISICFLQPWTSIFFRHALTHAQTSPSTYASVLCISFFYYFGYCIDLPKQPIDSQWPTEI
jgi:hypothetical protein